MIEIIIVLYLIAVPVSICICAYHVFRLYSMLKDQCDINKDTTTILHMMNERILELEGLKEKEN